MFRHCGSLIHWNTIHAASTAGRTPGFQRSLQEQLEHHLTHSQDQGSVGTWPVIAAALLSAATGDKFSLEYTKIEKLNANQGTRNGPLAQLPFFQGGHFSWQCSSFLHFDHRQQL